MNKQELLNELKKREHNNWSLSVPFNEGYRRGISFALELAKQLDEPKSELIEVPAMIAKFIKENSDPIFEICAWSDHYGSDGRTCDDPELSVVLDWYGSNTKEFYEAVLNGYVVKQEPKFEIDFGNGFILYQTDDEYWIESREQNEGYFKQQFTEQEIKSIDERYWAFAVPVDGSVEEI
nr:MAG TPA: Protein of unknown function (DUF1642) [Caudoviricetes sp.]